MDQRDSHCPYLLSSETTAKGTGLANLAGKEDPVELDSSNRVPPGNQISPGIFGLESVTIRLKIASGKVDQSAIDQVS
uniref:Uncharacterized protein n=1 Tax=Meloidogyne incognita TaxID=6306 RepID=A0A914NRF1_MELIC